MTHSRYQIMKLASRFRAVQLKRDDDNPIVVQIAAQMEVGDEKTGWAYEGTDRG
jgi:hypothetical protein